MFSFGHKKSTSPPVYTNTNLPTPSSSSTTNNNDATVVNRSSSQNRLSFTRADNGFEIVDSLPRTSSFSSNNDNNNNNSNRRNSSSSSSRNLNRNSSDSSFITSTPTTTELEIVVFKDGYEEQLLQQYEREEMERIQLEKDEEVRLKQLDDDRIMAKEMQSRLRMEHMQEQAQQLSNSMSSPSIDDDGGIVSDTVPSSSSSPVATIRTPTPTMSAADSYMGSNGSSPTTMMNEQYRRKSLPPVPQKRDSLTSPASMVHQASPNSPHFSTDQELMQYLSLVELGHEPSRCKFAVEAYRGDRIQTLDCISKLNQLVSWGFPEQRAREAILLCDRDLNQCLDYLSKLQQQDNQSHHLHHQTPPPSSTTGGSYPSYTDQSHASMNSSIMMDSMTNSGMYNPPPSSTLPFPSYPQQPYGSATSYPPPPTQYPPYGRGPYGY